MVNISCNSGILSIKLLAINVLLLIRRELSMLFVTRKMFQHNNFLYYKCPNSFAHSLITVAVSFGTQIHIWIQIVDIKTLLILSHISVRADLSTYCGWTVSILSQISKTFLLVFRDCSKIFSYDQYHHYLFVLL